MTIAEYQNAVLKANQALDIVEDILRALQHARLAKKFLQNAYTLAHFDDPIEAYGWEQ